MTTLVACPIPILQFFGNNGEPLIGGSVLTQVGGVNASTWQDVNGVTVLPNPIPLNSRGEVSNASGLSCQLFLTPNTVYVFTIFDANGNQIDQALYVNGVQFTLTPTNVGQQIWPQSAAELAANVTPTYYQYRWGDVRRYGAVGDCLIGGTVGPSGVNSNGAINQALSIAGQAVYIPAGNYLINNIIHPGGQAVFADGIHLTNLVCQTGVTASGVAYTDNGSAAKVNIFAGFAIYCNNQTGYTAGFQMGYGMPAPYGTESFIDQLWVRDLPAGIIAIDIKANIGQANFFVTYNSGGIRLVGTGWMCQDVEVEGCLGFPGGTGNTCLQLGDGNFTSFEVEAPASGTIPVYLSGNARVENPIVSFPPGATYDHVIEIGSSAGNYYLGPRQFYYTSSTRGAFSSANSYAVGDTVTSGGLTYISILTNNATSTAPPNATYWTPSPNITGGNTYHVTGTVYADGNSSGGANPNPGPDAAGIMLSGGTFGYELQQRNAFTIRVQNPAGTIQHLIGTTGGASVATNNVPSVNGAVNTASTTPTAIDSTHGFTAGAGISAASTNTILLDTGYTGTMLAANSDMFAQITFNNTGTAYVVIASVSANTNINGVTRPRLSLSLYAAIAGTAVAWSTALGTNTWIIDVTFVGFLT